MVASEKGVVVGRLAYREDGDLIDCQRMGVGGKAIPPNVDKVGSHVKQAASGHMTFMNGMVCCLLDNARDAYRALCLFCRSMDLCCHFLPFSIHKHPLASEVSRAGLQ